MATRNAKLAVKTLKNPFLHCSCCRQGGQGGGGGGHGRGTRRATRRVISSQDL